MNRGVMALLAVFLLYYGFGFLDFIGGALDNQLALIGGGFITGWIYSM